jgi:drug/metabolite transporter (DMT)-like permease
VLLLVVGASRWLLISAKPETEPTLASLTAGCAWAALVCVAFFVRSLPASEGRKSLAKGALAGALLLGGPMLVLVSGIPGIESSALVMALALTPVAVGVAASALGNESTESLTGRIWPGIAAVTGLLLVLVEPSFGDVRADVVLVLAPVMTGLGSAMFASAQQRGLRQVDLSKWLPTTALLGATLLFAAAWGISHLRGVPAISLSLTAVATDGVFALLSVLALTRLGAVRWSAQFTLLPLLILLEGIVMVRPVFTTRWVVGLVLVAAASVYLLLPQDDEEPEPTG